MYSPLLVENTYNDRSKQNYGSKKQQLISTPLRGFYLTVKSNIRAYFKQKVHKNVWLPFKIIGVLDSFAYFST